MTKKERRSYIKANIDLIKSWQASNVSLAIQSDRSLGLGLQAVYLDVIKKLCGEKDKEELDCIAINPIYWLYFTRFNDVTRYHFHANWAQHIHAQRCKSSREVESLIKLFNKFIGGKGKVMLDKAKLASNCMKFEKKYSNIKVQYDSPFSCCTVPF